MYLLSSGKIYDLGSGGDESVVTVLVLEVSLLTKRGKF